MERIQEHKLLEFHPDTLVRVRESCGLETPERVNEAIDLLRGWVAKQEHFVKKDFPRVYLETTIMASKGSVEKAKRHLDVMCTIRTLMPQFFTKVNVQNEFSQFHKVGKFIVLPKLTEDHYRVIVLRQSGKYVEGFYTQQYQFGVILLEYLRLHDYSKGLIFIQDDRNVNNLEFISHLNLTEVHNVLKLYVKGYGARLKGLHAIVNSSKGVDIFLASFKQFVNSKIASRINVHKNLEELHEHVPKHILPEDFGGEERSIDALNDEWVNLFSSEEHVKHMKEMQQARTDESRRLGELDSEMYGLSGTFKGLEID